MARASFKELRVLKTVSSVARLTRMSFSAVGAALTKGTLARAATVTARKREMNIVKYRYQEVVVRREGGCWLRGDSSEDQSGPGETAFIPLEMILARDPTCPPRMKPRLCMMQTVLMPGAMDR